ncbi:MAG TPA: PAS domain S-box protein [Dehalococcoidia bacterium]|nr:PAS domain S-box protein [Dehalococcoidia bacterium]
MKKQTGTREQLANELEKMRQRIAHLDREVTVHKQAEKELLKSELGYRLLAENVTDVIWTMDMNLQFTYISPSVTRQYGYSVEEAMASPIEANLTPSSFKAAMKVFEEEMAIEKMEKKDLFRPRTLEVEQYRKDGSTVWSELEIAFLRDADGQAIGIVGVSRDITERKRAEEALRESEEKIRNIFESILDAIVVSDLEGHIIDENDAALRIQGYSSKEEVIGKSGFEFIAEEDRARAIQAAMKAAEEGYGYISDVKFVSKDGIEHDTEATASLVRDASGNPIGFVSVTRDITEHKRALQESEEKYRLLIDNLVEPLTVYDFNGLILLINVTGANNLGSMPEDVIGKSLYDFFPDTADIYVERARRIFESGVGLEFEDEVPLPTGNRWFYSNIQPIKDTRGKVISVQNISYEITERKRAEEALRQSEEKLRYVFESMSDGVTVADLEGKIVDMNEAQLRLFGFSNKEEGIGQNGFDYFAAKDRTRAIEDAMKATELGYGPLHEYTFLNKDGREYDGEASASLLRDSSGNPVGFVSVVRDISERRRVEEALRESEEKYRTVIDHSIQGLVIAQGIPPRLIFANSSMAHILGYTVEELLSLSPEETRALVHPEDQNIFFQKYQDRLEGKSAPTQYEVRAIRKDKSVRWVEIFSTRIELQGQPSVQAAYVDITERKRAEEELRDSEEKLRGILDSLQAGVVIIDAETHVIVDANPAAIEAIGSTKEMIVGNVCHKFICPTEKGKCPITDLGKTVDKSERVLINASGENIPILKSVTNTILNGRLHLIESFVDFTERKRAEKALRDSEEKLHAMFEAITDGIVVTDLRGIITDVNDVAANMSGLSREEMIGQDGFALIPREDRDKVVDQGKKIVRGEIGPVRMEHEISPRIGSASTTNLVLGTMHDSDGNPTGFVAIAQDITERKRAEQERERLLEKLEDKSEELEQLVFIASHDLRSPLVNIQGFAREIEQSLQQLSLSLEEEDIPSALKEKLAAPIGEDITDSLNYILSSSSKIDSMLTGLLKVSRLGRVTLTIEKINMKDLMAEVVGSFEFQTREAGVKLEVGRLPQCRGDRAQLDQVFSNLIDNALKFLDPKRPGIIRISGRKEDRQAVYTVEDNGVGIAPEHHKTVFQIFRRFAPMDTPGEGLGLNIVRRILERHGGKIWLESEQGKGSRFHVSLPIRD